MGLGILGSSNIMLRLRNTLGNMHDPDMPAMAVFWRMWDWEAAHMMHLGDWSSLSHGRPRVGWFYGFRWAFNGCNNNRLRTISWRSTMGESL